MPLTGEAKKVYNAKYFAKHKDNESDEDGDSIDYSVIIAANALRTMGFGDYAVNKVVKHEDYKNIVKKTKEEIERWLINANLE